MNGPAMRWMVALLLCMVGTVRAIGTRDYAVELHAAGTNTPPTLVLDWTSSPDGVGAASITVARKELGAASWGNSISLGAGASAYTDTSVTVGVTYEYKVTRVRSDGVTAYGYVAAGIDVPAVHSRGTAVMLVDATLAPLAASEIERFTGDLYGDGWAVIRHDIPRTNKVTAIRGLIQADRVADSNVTTVIILGCVPQPYSGNLNPDGHFARAMPTDAYFADTDGMWTDTTVDDTSAPLPRNDNVPGDGKFDQDTNPSTLELDVGRIDFRDFPAFALAGESATNTEARLLRRYLDKDHAWRQRQFTVPARGLIDDSFLLTKGDPFAAVGWRNYAALAGGSNVIAADWFNTGVNGYLLAFGAGSGSADSCAAVGDSAAFATRDSRVVFTFLFGSYFEDWNYTNSLLRAPLANGGYGLTCSWGARPNWFIHQMGMGQTIGYCARQTANNNGLYLPTTSYQKMVHIGLMGDPTLRLHGVAPPTELTASTNGTVLNLTWTHSADAGQSGFRGYYVYRASGLGGPWTRLTETATNVTHYTDPSPTGGAVYKVCAARWTDSNSGRYENLSQGVFVRQGNALPIIGVLADQTMAENTVLAPVPFSVADEETAATSLVVTAESSDTKLVPFGNVTIGGSGGARTVSVMPVPNQHGEAWITVMVSDGIATASRRFLLTVESSALIWDPGHGMTNTSGGAGIWSNTTAWYGGGSWTNWRDWTDAVFGGTTGTVELFDTVNRYRYVSTFQVDTPGYEFSATGYVNGASYLNVEEFIGSEKMTFTSGRTNGSTLFHLVPTNRATYRGDFRKDGAASYSIYADGGTLELDRTNANYSSLNAFYASGTLLLNTSRIPFTRYYVMAGGVLGGTGSPWVQSPKITDDRVEVNVGGILAPGDPAVDNGIGTLTFSERVWFYRGTNGGLASVLRAQIDSPALYDKLLIIGTNTSSAAYPFEFGLPTNSNYILAPRLELEIASDFTGGATNDFLCLMESRVGGAGGGLGCNGIFANAPSNSYLLFTNEAKTVYTFQYKYNVDKANASMAGNDFGLLITGIQAPPGYTITATAGVHGAISPSGEVPVASGADQGFIITADPYYHVEDIVVDGGSVGAAGDYTFLNVGTNHTIVAGFAENRAANGTPEWWLVQYRWTNEFDAAATNDADGDTMQNWAEYRAGTDPTNKASRLAFEALVMEPGSTGVVVRWQGIPGKTYRLDCGTNLMDGEVFSTVIRSNIAGNWPVNVETDRTGFLQGPRFYRVTVE